MHSETKTYLGNLLNVPEEQAVRHVMHWRAIQRDSSGSPKIMQGTYEAMHDTLTSLNQQGYGIYVTVNATTGTKDKDVWLVRALFVDNDHGALDAPFPLAPTMRVMSGHGDHAYWCVDDADLKHFKFQQQTLAKTMHTDIKVCNLSRIMRVPGFLWTKPDNRADWRKVGIEVTGPRVPNAPSVITTLTVPPNPLTAEWAAWRLWCKCLGVRTAEAGKSQNTLNVSAFEIKDYCRLGILDSEEARRSLAEAAAERGVDGIESTLDSAFNAPGSFTNGLPSSDTPVGTFASPHEEDMARNLLKWWGAPDHVASVGGLFYRYIEEEGVWKVRDTSDLQRDVTEHHNAPFLKSDGKQGYLPIGIDRRKKVALALVGNPDIWVEDADTWRKDAPAGLGFSDGFLTVDGALVPHSPENRALWAFPWAWGEEGAAFDPPLAWAKFFSEIWADCTPQEREARSFFIGAWYGSALMGMAPRWAKAIFCLGRGANGKSILLNALAECVPSRHREAVPVNMWSNEYYTARLAPPVVLNVVPEMRAGDWMGSDVFKSIISGDMTAARPIYGTPIRFRPIAGHIIALNELPGSSDRTEGFWRRIEVLPFDVSFKGREASSIELHAELMSEAEPMIRWAVGCAFLANHMGALPSFEGGAAVKDEWEFSNDPVAQWLSERTEPCEKGILAGMLFADFQVWAQINGQVSKSSAWWGRQMRRLDVGKKRSSASHIYLCRLK